MPLKAALENPPKGETSPWASQLTPRQLQLLKAIRVFQAGRCYSPTIAELASELTISRSTTFEHIAELRKKDLLSASPTMARSLRLTSKAQKLLNSLDKKIANCQSQVDAAIPLAGKVAAGVPIEAVENIDSLSLNSCFGTGDDVFALEVKGDSMTGDGIADGDFVICRKRSTANNGQLVVAIVDDENATLKRFYREKSSVRLQPSNDNYDPIYSDNCRIEAVVVGLVRKL
ncbi:MAG: transcriptional repressor LexA [Phycisphaerae bacterium]|nr:transcriptional repressor LexA [Phycisphaerae bacterium]